MSSFNERKDSSGTNDPLEIARKARKNYEEALDYTNKTEEIYAEIEAIHRKDLAFLDKAIAHLDENQAKLDQMSKELKESAKQADLRAKQADDWIVRYKALQKKIEDLNKTSPTYETERQILLAEQAKLEAELDALERSIEDGSTS